MKRAVLTLVFAVAATCAGAQGIERVTRELARPGFGSGARIEIALEDDAAAALRNADHPSGRTTVMAYGVSLFRDNSQNAGADAQSVRAQFAEIYPDVPVTLSYENPYFKVETGPFIDRVDAVALCGKVLSAGFRQAVVSQREVSLADIIATERTEPALSVETADE
jgi:hypothetical protein